MTQATVGRFIDGVLFDDTGRTQEVTNCATGEITKWVALASTKDDEAARFFADKVNVEMVGINVPLPNSVAYHGLGG